MKKSNALLTGLGLGAGLMYAFDPGQGRRRRAVARDKALHAGRVTRESVGKAKRDLSHRVKGATHRVSTAVSREIPDDRVLEERVRSGLGHRLSRPGEVEVQARCGRVVLRGAVPAGEVEDAVRGVRHIRGVRDVVDELDRGGEPEPPEPSDGNGRSAREAGNGGRGPAARFLAGAGGGALAVVGARQGGMKGAALGMTGLGLLARGLVRRYSAGGRR